MKVAFQGEPGAYSEAALRAHFGPDIEAVPLPAFEALFKAVAAGEVAHAVVPIENSLGGSVHENFDWLLAYDLPIIAEVQLAVKHCLLAKRGTALADVKRAYSHPQALAQTMPFLRAHGITPCPAYDTAGAARELAGRDEDGAAAIASARAAEIYGLDIVARDLQSRDDNTTRFFVIAPTRPADLVATKASFVFAARNVPGSLHACLGVFAGRGLNLVKIESRPTRDTPWEYHFYVDVQAPAGSVLSTAALADVAADLGDHAVLVRLLGAYPSA